MHKSLTKVIPLKFDYVVINTGYVSRTISHFLNHGFSFNLQFYEHDRSSFVITPKKTKDRLISKSSINNENNVDAYLYVRKYDREPDYMEYDDETGDDIVKPNIPLYISDYLWGEGMYINVNADVKEIDMIHKCICDIYEGKDDSIIRATYGTIAFKCNDLRDAFKIARNLATLDYCSHFDANDPYDIASLEDETSGKRILYLKYDCESG